MGIAMAMTNGYSPIRISGVMKSDGTTDATAELPIVYTLRLPYVHHINNQSTYLKITCGISVSFNFLICSPFLSSAEANLCFKTNTLR